MNRSAVLVAALVITIGAGAALYGINRSDGNVETAAACSAAPSVAAGLADLATGELAAFQLARKAEDLSALAFKDGDGAPLTLAAFAGRVTLTNLWATWCAPCRREMPALDRLQVALGSDDFAVVTINIDAGSWERPKQFLEEIDVPNLPRYRDETTGIFQEMKSRGLAIGLPVTVLTDRSGCLLGHVNGPAEWDSDDAKRLIEAAVAAS